MNFELVPSRDWQLAWNISQDPAVFDRVTNDEWGAEPEPVRREHVRLLVEDPKNIMLTVKAGEEIGGCFIFDQKEPGTYEVHTMLLPNCRGAHAIVAGRQAARWMFEHGADKLVSFCPMNHREILFFALKCGFHKAGKAALSWIKAGAAFDLETVELERKDFAPCH